MLSPRKKAVTTQMSPRRQNLSSCPLQESLGAALMSHSADTQRKHSNHKAQNFSFVLRLGLELLFSSLDAAALQHEHLAILLGIYLPALFPCGTGDVECRQIQQHPLGKKQIHLLWPTLLPEEGWRL